MTEIAPARNGQGGTSAVPVSAVLITRNSASTIADCLASLRSLPEVIVYDNGSEDATVEIAARFPNTRVHRGEFLGFGPTRNRAAALATCDWILSIDSDERLDPGLVASLAGVDYSRADRVYAVWRRNYMLGRLVRHSGWGRDWLPRMYHRSRARFTDAAVHERLVRDPGVEVRRLSGDLHHDAVREIGDLLEKVNRYSELRRREGTRTYPPALIFLRAVWAFVRTWLLQGGVLDGWRGLVIAWSNANGVFFKYMKRYADRAAGEVDQGARSSRR